MRIVYNILFAIFFVLSLPYYFYRLWRRGNWRVGVGQRFGFYDAKLRDKLAGRKVIWFHAVSVGEVNLCALLIAALGARLDGWTVLASTTTTTGMEELRRKLTPDVIKIYYPVDFPLCVNRALKVIRPQVVTLVEAEIWPNLMWRLRDLDVPVLLANARLSDRSARRYGQCGFLFRSIFSNLAAVGVQNDGDAARLVSVGCRSENVKVTGNLKFDAIDLVTEHRIDPRRILNWAGISDEALVLLGSSTHAGEERLLAEIYQRLRPTHSRLRLVVVPRHFERGAEVKRELTDLGLVCCLRSDYSLSDSADHSGKPESDCLIVDSTGELRFFFDVADVVFVGKSMLACGGQNPIEPAAAAKAVVFGPHMENFRIIAKNFVKTGSMIQVRDRKELEQVLERLVNSEPERRSLGEAAQAEVNRNRGALERTVDLVSPFLDVK